MFKTLSAGAVQVADTIFLYGWQVDCMLNILKAWRCWIFMGDCKL